LFDLNVGPGGEGVDEAIGGLHWLAGMGIQTVHAAVRDIHTITPLEVIAERVMPAVAGL
jgi:alkanesulfonate monooxygenase